MTEYNIKVIIPENDLTTEKMEQKVKEFQIIFVTVASRYYNQKKDDIKGS